MLKRLTHFNLWVHDHDAALAFYTGKLGMEVRNDVTFAEMGGYRFVTVGPPGQPDLQLILSVPGPPVMDAETVQQLNGLLAKGVIGGVHYATDDCQATFEELRARGVAFNMEPTEMPYGIDAAFRDPSGNQFRVTQLVG